MIYTHDLVTLALVVMGAFALGGFCVFLACLLGGWLVFRTKREAHEVLFPLGRNHAGQEEPVNADPLGGTFFDEAFGSSQSSEEEDIDMGAKIQQDATTRFLHQMAADRARAEMTNAQQEGV